MSDLSSVQFSCSVVPNTLWPHGLQHARFPCPVPTPRACSNSYPLNQWCHQTTSSCVVPFSSCLQSFPASVFFSNESVLCTRWPKCWSFSFSISPSKEYSGLISFKIDWFDFAIQGILKNLFQHHSSKALLLQCSVFFIYIYIYIHIYICCLIAKSDSFGTPWTVSYQAPLSIEFPRQEYWSELPFPSAGIFPTQHQIFISRITTEPPGKPICICTLWLFPCLGYCKECCNEH